MAFAIFADIHGNLEALEAIIKDTKKNRKIKQLYFCGDAVTFGPDSSACLKLLKKHKVYCVVGNHEQRFVRYDNAAKSMTYASKEHLQYIFSSIDKDDLCFIKDMPIEIKINYKGVNILFTHYGHDANGVIRDDYEEFTEPMLFKMFGDRNCDVVFFGHIHNRKIIIDENGKSYVCLGSSGCVKGNKTFYTYFDIHNEKDRNFDIYRVNVPFNRKKFDEKMLTASLPDRNKYAPFCFGLNIEENKK
jgi:putative phosphoesterase